MTPAARVQTAIELLDAIIDAARNNGASADVVLAKGFRERRYAGSKDRRAIRDLVYRAIRAHDRIPASGRAAILALEDSTLSDLFGADPYGPAAVTDADGIVVADVAPNWIDGAFLPFIDAAERVALLGRAPLDLRANALKADRQEMLALYPDARPIAHTTHGFRFETPVDLERDPAYLDGRFEVQDAGSQIISRIAVAEAADIIVDLCAGAGGKTLSLAADKAGSGQVIACDTDRTRLQQLPPRAARAAATIRTRLLNPGREMEALEDLRAGADIVLVDAPCSGSGTWRRNPELRWRLTPERLARTVALQAQVLHVAAQLVKPGGALVYAVCSLFTREGPGQIGHFLQAHPDFAATRIDIGTGRPAGEGLALTPLHDATDGFFVARLARSC